MGVIVGEDLVWRDGWQSDLSKNKDGQFKNAIRQSGDDLTEKLRNVYRVLMTRARKGTFVYFLDPETKRHIEEMLQ